MEDNLLNKKRLNHFFLCVRKLRKEEKVFLWNRITNENYKRRRKQVLYYRLSIAAAIMVLFSASLVFYFHRYSSETLTSSDYMALLDQNSIPASDSIQLVLSNKKSIRLSQKESDLHYQKDGTVNINNKIHKANALVKADAKKEIAKEDYNILTVPYGKSSHLRLADGTEIWVNANTKVVYPATFTRKTREIYVDGEVYLHVARDEKHPFVVKTEGMKVRVLGTVFCVNAHKEKKESSVVLVSGRVEVNTKHQEKILKPNERLVSKGKEIQVKTVNVNRYISWKSGKYVLDKNSLAEVFTFLSSYYGLNFHYSQVMKTRYCSGTINLTDDYQKILQLLEKTNRDIKFTVSKSNQINVIVKP